MRFIRQRWLLLILAAALYVYGVWSLGTASSFHACVQSETKAAAQESEKGFPPSPFPIIDRSVFIGRCTLHEMYAYRDLMAAVATVLIAIFTFTLWQSTKSLWEAGEKQLSASHRPWVAIEAALMSDVTYDADGSMRATFRYKLANLGNTPALKVRQVTKLVTVFGDPTPHQKALVEAEKRRSFGEKSLGYTLFQNNPFALDISLTLSKADMDKFTEWWRESFTDFEGEVPIMPSLVGCISYQNPIQKSNHHTAFICDLRRKDPKDGSGEDAFFPSMGTISINQVKLIWREWGSVAD